MSDARDSAASFRLNHSVIRADTAVGISNSGSAWSGVGIFGKGTKFLKRILMGHKQPIQLD